MRFVALLVFAGCAQPIDDARDAFVRTTLAEDNYAWALRDPDLVHQKFAKMQRDPYTWLRGTLAVYWRDANSAGARTPSEFGDAATSRVLLVGDPHPENVGTYRTASGDMVVEWNDFDAAGYGPFTLDVRRLAAGMMIATGDDAIARDVAEGYVAGIAQPIGPLGTGVEKILDKLIAKAQRDGDAGKALDDIAPRESDGVRRIAFGDGDPVADDGVIENRLSPVGAEAARWIDRAIAQWNPAAHVALRCRRFGSGVASLPALRYYVILDDETVLELKETRDGVIVDGVPRYDAAEWNSPGARVVDAQHRLHAQRDSDPRLGSADLGGLSLKIRDRASYQRGLDAGDIGELPIAEQRSLARTLGALLARAHGESRDAIAPLIGGRESRFVDEIAAGATTDVAQLREDFMRGLP